MENLALKLALAGKKKFYEGYASVAASGSTQKDLKPSANHVLILLNVDVSFQYESTLSIYKGNLNAVWLPAIKVLRAESGDKVFSVTNLNIVIKTTELVRVKVDNRNASNSSVTYLNLEYLDLTEDEFTALQDLVRKETGLKPM